MQKRTVHYLFSQVLHRLEEYQEHINHYNENTKLSFVAQHEIGRLTDFLNYLYYQGLARVVLKLDKKWISL